MRYFVSGHRDITFDEFFDNYVPLLDKVRAEDSNAEFIVGDWEGCDMLTLEYLLCDLFPYPNITIYGVDKIRINPYGLTPDKYPTVNIVLKTSYDECDASMTTDSDFDIAWIKPGKEDSHTAKNIKRRFNL